MIEASNLKRIKEKSEALMIDYQFVSFDLVTYFNSDLIFKCKTIIILLSLIVFLKYTSLNSL